MDVRRGPDRGLFLHADWPNSRYLKDLALNLYQPGALDLTVVAVDRTFR